jgi:adenylate cyclase
MGAGRYMQAAELAQRSMQIAEHEGESSEMMLAHYNLAELNFRLGSLDSSRQHVARALQLYERQHHASLMSRYGVDIKVLTSGFAAWNNCWLGFLNQALKDADSTVEHARGINHAYSLATALMFLFYVQYWRREPQAIMQTVTETMALCAEHAFREWDALARAAHGWALAALGKPHEGISEVVDSVKAMQSLGITYPSFTMELLAETCLVGGAPEKALVAADEGLAMVAQTGERCVETALLCCKGEALSRLGRVEEAVRLISTAIDLARAQSAKLYGLRATTSLARLLERHGRRDEARTMLADIYNWFTEGFDTADLKDAKALLDELGA